MRPCLRLTPVLFLVWSWGCTDGQPGPAGQNGAAVEVLAPSPVAGVFDGQEYAGKGDPKCVVRIVGARNGAFSGQLVLAAARPVKGKKAVVTEFRLMDGSGTIPASAVTIRYGLPDGAEGKKKGRFDTLLDAPRPEGEVHDVWITVRVPADAKPGDYVGMLAVGGISAPVRLEVFDWEVPRPHEFLTHAGLIQSPESVALQYKVPLWSDRHFACLGKSLELLGQVDNKVAFIPIVCQTHFGNSEGMVRWIKDGDGYKHDFAPFEKYLDLYIEKCGKPEFVCFCVWDRSLGVRRQSPEREGQALAGVPVSLLADPATGRVETMTGPGYDALGSKAFWKPVMDGLRERMRKRGLPDSAFLLGIVEPCLSPPHRSVTETFKEVAPHARWLAHTCSRFKEVNGVPIGYISYTWGAGKDPAKGGPYYGWSVPETITVFPRYGGTGFMTEPVFPDKPLGVHRCLGETTLVHNVRGFGQVGADFWPVLPDGKGGMTHILNRYHPSRWGQFAVGNACDAFLAPGPEGAVATVRFENLREGLQECEARIFIEKALADQALCARLGEALAGRCEAVLAGRVTGLLDTFKRGKESKGWDWFAAGWQDRSEKLFSTAAEVAGALKATRPAAVQSPESLVGLLRDRDAKVRRSAGEALAAYFRRSRPVADQRERRLRIVQSWWKADSDAFVEEMAPVLIVALTDPYTEIRTAAAGTLRRMGSKAREAIPDMAAALKDSSWEVRAEAAHGLAEIGREVAGAIPALAKAIGDSEPNIGWCAVEALGDIGPKAREALPTLVEELRDSNPEVREGALRVLGSIGPGAAEAIPAIEPLLDDKDAHVRSAAAEALKKIRGQEPPK